MRVFFSKLAQKQYEDCERVNPKMINKINQLIADIQMNGFLDGIGKPEQLKYYKNPPRFSRHITHSDRLVYCPCNGSDLLVLACKGHYKE